MIPAPTITTPAGLTPNRSRSRWPSTRSTATAPPSCATAPATRSPVPTRMLRLATEAGLRQIVQVQTRNLRAVHQLLGHDSIADH
jgi:hypothetical protein